MKSLLQISLITAGILSAALPAATAADPSTAPATAPAPAQRPGRPGPLARMMIRRHLAQKLGLSSDQMAQLKSVRQSAAANVKAIRADTSLTPDQKHARVREVVASAREQMKSVLTPDQQAKLQEIRQNARNKRGT